ncbi:MAG: hypothetical protein M1840_000323 [Geoglossum simile]|nr:MAG: hypothetical protein M1840_000323 [Geoglossum simile]
MPKRPVHLPGTTLEGGGQLLRNALALSSLTRTAVHISSIRGNRRDGGGLKAQHLSGLLWLAQATGAAVEGAARKSKAVIFRPAGGGGGGGGGSGSGLNLEMELGARAGRIDIGSAGSVFLVFQAVLPVLVFGCPGQGPISLTVSGGTTTSHAPSYEYARQVLLPTLARIGLPPITLSPPAKHNPATGLAEVTFTVTPLAEGATLPAFDIASRGEVERVDVTVEARSPDVRGAVMETLYQDLQTLGFPDIQALDRRGGDGDENTLHILLTLHTTTSCTLAASAFQTLSSKRPPNISALRHLASATAKALWREWDRGACVDRHMQDQLVVFQALAAGRCSVVAAEEGGSLHTQTARWVAARMLGVEWDGRGECEGAGWRGGETWASRKDNWDALADEVEELEIS